MIRWIDDRLLHFAKRMIEIAAFFGISRRQLMNGWIYGAHTVCIVNGLLYYTLMRQISIAMTMVVMFTVGAPIIIGFANSEFREDDILPESWGLKVHKVLCQFFVIFFLVASLANLVIWGSWQSAHILLWIVTPFFYVYILLNQDPPKKVALRDFLTNIFSKLQRQPAPVHTPR